MQREERKEEEAGGRREYEPIVKEVKEGGRFLPPITYTREEVIDQ